MQKKPCRCLLVVIKVVGFDLLSVHHHDADVHLRYITSDWNTHFLVNYPDSFYHPEAPRVGVCLWIHSPLVVASPGVAGVGTADRERVGMGDSIAITVCLTVEEVHPPHLSLCVVKNHSQHNVEIITARLKVHLEGSKGRR